jgi:hypothetical protein
VGRILVVAFLLAHAFVHVAVWAMPKPGADTQPFDPRRSWALAAAHVAIAPARTASVAAALTAAVLYGTAGVALAFDLPVWVGLASAGALAGLLLKTLWFNPWLSLGVALDLGVLLAVAAQWPAGLY